MQAGTGLIYEEMRRAFAATSLAGNWDFIERWAMKPLQIGVVSVLSLFLTACLYGQCINGPCSFERERILNSIKAYGEYFEKPGMTKESWRADWIACGGKSNGDYSSEVPSGSSTAVLLADSKRKAEQLSSCMQSKGYHYQSPLK